MSKELLDIYTDYLISQNSYATGLSNLLDGQISHDKITRFLNKEQFCAKDLWQYVKAEVHKQEQEKGGGATRGCLEKLSSIERIILTAG